MERIFPPELINHIYLFLHSQCQQDLGESIIRLVVKSDPDLHGATTWIEITPHGVKRVNVHPYPHLDWGRVIWWYNHAVSFSHGVEIASGTQFEGLYLKNSWHLLETIGHVHVSDQRTELCHGIMSVINSDYRARPATVMRLK